MPPSSSPHAPPSSGGTFYGGEADDGAVWRPSVRGIIGRDPLLFDTVL